MTQADLDARVTGLRDRLYAIRRELAGIRREYDRVDIDTQAVDELGDHITSADALASAGPALDVLDRAVSTNEVGRDDGINPPVNALELG